MNFIINFDMILKVMSSFNCKFLMEKYAFSVSILEC